MRTSAKWMLLLTVTAALGLLGGCGDEDNPVAVVQWDLTINNNTATIYDIYQDTDLAGSDFVNVGQVGANGSHTITDLTTSVNYTFRLVPNGQPVGDFEHETTLSSSGNDRSWTVP